LDSITSTRSPRVARVRSLKTRAGRRETGLFLVEGPDGVVSARASGLCDEVWATDAGSRLLDQPPDVVMSDRVCSLVSETETPQGVIAICRQPTWSLDEVCRRPGPLVWADGVADPGNLGTIIRTIDAVGGAGLITSPQSVDAFNGKVVRASAGSLLNVPIVNEAPIETVASCLGRVGRPIVVLAGDAARDVFTALRDSSIPANACWVVGSEARGVSHDVRSLADIEARIPMPGNAESLNAAVATAVVLYAAWDRLGPWA
jgi:TrmH family RNA methyltransferase